uniref:Endonuclease/exonuclease/phosphatase domain-containing protein n=1 Tax=viral metagenome TaxID=1070528 RepID=A0A6C0ENL8_9ZZZZ
MYSKIVNPKTGRWVNTSTKLGKTIINNYLNMFDSPHSGGATRSAGIKKTKKDSNKIKVGTWNLLSDGLSMGEFLSDKGDKLAIEWGCYDEGFPTDAGRGQKIVDVIGHLFNSGLDILGTQENDHPKIIHDALHTLEDGHEYEHIKLITLHKYDEGAKSNSLKFLEKREPSTTDSKGELQNRYCRGDLQNDTVSIYYNSDKLNQVAEPMPITISTTKGVNSYAQMVCMEVLATGKKLHVVCGHLKSGEKAADAAQRLMEIEQITDATGGKENVIMLLDSNSSYQYESSLFPGTNSDDVLHALKSNGFADVLEPRVGETTGNECYKMRHGSGGQPKKFGTMMLDQIDKIVIGGTLSGTPLDLPEGSPFVKYTNKLLRIDIEHLKDVRNNKDGLRKQLEKLVKDERWSDVVGQQRGEVSKTVEDRGKMIAVEWNPMYQSVDDNDILPQRLQMALYPNMNAPSDHPPCLATIQL